MTICHEMCTVFSDSTRTCTAIERGAIFSIGVHFVLKELGIKPHPHVQQHRDFNTTLGSMAVTNLTALNDRNVTALW